MSLLCHCIRLDAITPTIVQLYGAEASWTTTGPKEGELEVSLLGGPPCSGGSNSSQFVSCILKMNGCGRLRITVSGDGSLYWPYPIVSVSRMAPAFEGLISSHGVGGLEAGCDTAPLVDELPNPAEIKVCCGQRIYMEVHELYNEGSPDLELTIKVEVI